MTRAWQRSSRALDPQLIGRMTAFVAGAVVIGLALPSALDKAEVGPPWFVPAALVVALVALCAVFARPTIAVWAAFLLLPVVRFEPAPADVVLLLLMMVAVLGPRPRVAIPVVIGVPVLLLVVLTVLSMANATDSSRAMRFEFITLYLVAFAVWVTVAFQDEKVLRIAMKAFVIGAVVSALVGIVALEIGFPGSETFVYAGFRAKALFKDVNVFGPYLVFAALVVVEDILRPRLLGWRLSVRLTALFILLGGILVAYSRAAWLNLAIGLFLVILIYAWRRGGFGAALKGVTLVAAALFAGLGLLYVTGSLGFFEYRSAFQSYDSDRFSTQSETLRAMTDFVFGHGPGQVESYFAISAHSLYLRMGFEQGLLGLVLIAVIVAITLALAFDLVLRDADVGGVGSAALFAAWFGTAVNAIVIDAIHWRHLWLLAGLIWLGAASRKGIGSRAGIGQRPPPVPWATFRR